MNLRDHWMRDRAVLILPVNALLYRTLSERYQRGAGGPIDISGQRYSVESCDRHGLDPHCARVTLRLDSSEVGRGTV